ncbi:glycosyltransferase family 2 protein [Campylobacterota bacterium DY0563]
MDEKLISVAMCTYNGGKYLKEQLDSIINQTYKNIEIIICDDGSTDNTIDIIKNYSKKYNFIKLFQNETNLGFVKNFEKSISLCKGDYIALADQDDIWKVNKLEVFLCEIGDNLLIYSDAIIMDGEGTISNNELIRPKGNLVKGRCNKAFLFTNCVSGNTLMFKKELIKDIVPIPEKITYHDIWIAFVASSLGTITFTQEALTYYRRYAEQITSTREKNYKSFIDRFQTKKASNLKSAKDIIDNLSIFETLEYLDKDIKLIIKESLIHFNNFSNSYFNYKLFKILKKYKDEVFAIKKDKKRLKYIRRISYGLKAHIISLFTI